MEKLFAMSPSLLQDIKEEILELDDKMVLKVYKWLHLYESNPKVKFFVDKLLQHGILPIFPPEDVVQTWLEHDVIVPIDASLKTYLSQNFSFYLMTKLDSETFGSGFFAGDDDNDSEDEAFGFSNSFSQFMSDIYASNPHNIIENDDEFMMQYAILKNVNRTLQYIENTLHITDQYEIEKTLQFILGKVFAKCTVEMKLTSITYNLDQVLG